MSITSINLGKIKFNWKGAWSLGVAYVKDDVVRYNGSSYVCILGHTSATSWANNSSKFELMAEGTTPTTTKGDLIYRDTSNDTRLGIGASGQVLTVSTGGVPTWADNGVLNKIYYVAPTGSDSNSGQSWGTAFATIKHACSVAVGPATIRVASGTFSEALPITVPSFVAVIGDNQRTTIVGPASGYEQLTMWKLGDGALLNKMCFIGLTGYTPYVPDPTNIELATTGGVYVAFDPATPIATKSPYIIECTAKSAGGIGALLDGGVHASGNRSMVFHGYTVILDGGVGYWIKDNAKSEIVSCFTYFCHMGYAATGGGKIRALNGNNSYGTYGALASGYNTGESTNNGTIYGNMLTWQAGTLVSSFTDGDTITGGSSGTTGTVVNVQSGTSRIYYKKVTGTGFTAGETITNGSGASATIATGGVTGQTGVILVVTGLTAEPKPGGSIEITGDTVTYVVQSSSGWTNSGSKVVIVLAADKASYSNDGTGMKIRYDYSNIRLTGHDFLNIGTGGVASTNYPGIPVQAPSQGNEVVELFPGRVFYVSTDQDGNFRVGEYFKVDQATGRATLNASAFDLSGLTSLRLGSIGAQLGELVNEFSSDATLSGNSNAAVPTERAVKQYFTQISSNNVPSVDNAYSLGTSAKRWSHLYVGPGSITIGSLTITDNAGTLEVKTTSGGTSAPTTLNSINNGTSNVTVALDGNVTITGGGNLGLTVDSSGNAVFSGNVTVNGGATNLSTTNLNIADALIYMATGNNANANDIGIMGHFTAASTYQHTGVVRRASTGSWMFFSGVTTEPTTTIPVTDGTFTYDPVTMAALTATSGTFSGTIAANASGGITTTQTTFPLVNTTATTVNAFGASTSTTIGASTGTHTVNNATVTLANATALNINGTSPGILTSSTGTASVFNTNALTGNLFGAATSISIGASSGTLTIGNATITGTNATTLNLNGSNPSIVTSSTGTASVFNTNALTGNLFGAATTVSIGAASGTTTIKGNLAVDSGKTFAIKGSSSGSITFQAAAAAGSVTYTLPSTDGTNGFALVTNGSGTLSWAVAGATITDDSSTTTLYPVMSSSNTGNFTSAKLSSTKYTFNALTGVLTTSGGFVESSSIALKENVNPITGALDAILNLVGVTYDRKDGSRKNEAGLIAEEVEQIIPNLVSKDADGNAQGIYYSKLTAYLVEAIKGLQSQIDPLKEEIKKLKGE
jgi:lipopolysaccharide export system protein LptA